MILIYENSQNLDPITFILMINKNVIDENLFQKQFVSFLLFSSIFTSSLTMFILCLCVSRILFRKSKSKTRKDQRNVSLLTVEN